VGLRLLVLTADVDPPPSVLIKGRKAAVGRGQDCEIRLPDPSVSLHHATIRKRGDSYLLFDEGSSHGTGIGTPESPAPVWLAPDSPRVIEDGEHLWFGQIEVLAQFHANKRGEASGYEELPHQLVEAGLRAAELNPTPELIESTLQELTELEDELFEEEQLALPDPIGVAGLEEEDRHPPWMADAMVAGIAVCILAGCALGMAHLAGLT